MTHIRRFLPLLVLPVLCIQLSQAQSTIDLNVGFGAPQAKANATGLDAGSANLTACGPTTISGNCLPTSALGGFMMGVGANAILWKKFGIGGEANFQPGKPVYVDFGSGSTLNSRITFYDFNGIYQPVAQEKVALQLVGGVGGANIKFYSASSGSLLGGSAYANYPISSSNHFQVHGGVGVQLYVSGNFFIRPQFDVHYVPNFIQYGRNVVTRESVWIGYTMGERQ